MATKYINPSGSNDTGDGTSGNPWQTVAYGISQCSSGDTLFLQAGTYPVSSTVNVGVGISMMGEGDTSIISSTVSTAWQATLRLRSTVEGTNGNQTISYIKFDGNDTTAFSAIYMDARSNVSVHHCTFIDFFKYGVLFDGTAATGGPPSVYATGNSFHHNTMDNCSDYQFDVGYGCFMNGGQIGIEIYNNHITNNSRTTRRNGYNLKYWNGYNKGEKIYNNTLIRSDDLPSGAYFDFCIELWHTQGGCEIYNNTMTGGIDFGGATTMICLIPGDYEYGAWVHDNVIGYDTMHSNTIGIYLERNTDGLICERNLIKGVYNAINVTPAAGETAQNHIFRYNIFDKIGYYGIWSVNDATGATIYNIKVDNNVIRANSYSSLIGVSLIASGTTSYYYLRNNIITGFGGFGPCFCNGSSGQTMDHLYIQNNIFYGNGNSNNPYLYNITPTNYTNEGTIKQDPLYTDPTNGDFTLQAGSPGLNAGLDLGLSLDFRKYHVPYGAAPDIGAYEYGSSVTALIEGTWLVNYTILNNMFTNLYNKFV